MDAIELEFNNSWDVFIERTENINFVSQNIKFSNYIFHLFISFL